MDECAAKKVREYLEAGLERQLGRPLSREELGEPIRCHTEAFLQHYVAEGGTLEPPIRVVGGRYDEETGKYHVTLKVGLGWFQSLPPEQRAEILSLLGHGEEEP